MVLPLVPAEGSVNVMEVLSSIPEAAAKYLRFGQSLTPDAYFSTLLGSEFQCRNGLLQFAPNSPAKALAQQEAAVKKGQRGSRGMAPPPPPPSSFVSQRGAPTGFAAQQHLQQQTAKTTFRTPTEVLEVMVEYVLSGDRTDVNSVVVKWEGDNEKTAEAVLSVDPKDPDRFHHQVLSLTKGHYEVEVRVTRTDATSQSKSFEVEVGEGEQSVSLELNLVREK